MIKAAVFALLAFALAACASSSPEQTARNRVGAIVALYGSTASVANGYVHRPFCTAEKPLSPTNVCADRATVRRIQQADRAAHAAISSVHVSLEQNPSGPGVQDAINAADSAVKAFAAVTPK